MTELLLTTGTDVFTILGLIVTPLMVYLCILNVLNTKKK
jgi:hypothetical protein